MSTVEDMYKSQQVLNENILLKATTLDKAFNGYLLETGEKIEYGYGWHPKELTGVPSRKHGERGDP